MNKFKIKSGNLSITLKSIFCFLMVMSSLCGGPQSDDYILAPPGADFEMHVSRVKSEIYITIAFSDSLVFDYVSVERKAEFEKGYGQCMYITYDEVKSANGKITRQDHYPYPGNSEVSYRLRLVSRDGPMRTYPTLSLPPVTK